MFYDELLAKSDKEVSIANFCMFADVVASRYEIEHPQVRFFHNIPRKPRTSVTRNPNKNWGSSSFLFLGDHASSSVTKPPQNPSVASSSSLALMATETTELKNPSENPNTLSSTSVQETTRKSRSKTEKVKALSWKDRGTPERLLQLVRDKNGTEPMLVFEKTLTQTDIRRDQCRLLMPFNSMIRNNFLTNRESTVLEQDINNDENVGVGAIMYDERNVEWGVILKRWEMKKSSNYALISGWSDMVTKNGLVEGSNISVWSFRRRGDVLCFAIVPPPVE